MEKLQAALAKARAQRDGKPAPRSGQAEVSTRTKSRILAESEALSDLWEAIQEFEPSAKKMKQNRIFTHDPNSEAAQFDVLRTKLVLEARRNDWTRIAVTSAASSSGKTTTACNLIAGFGRQPELRGILFDFDFRRPAVAKMLGASPTQGVADVLEDKVPFEEQAVRLHPNTIISMTNRSIKDPARILHTQRSAEILDEIQEEYRPDIMLFDLPPILAADETRAFLNLVDAVLIIASADATTVSQLDECEREVAQYSNVAGIVLNKCRFLDEGYGYSY